MIKHVAAALTIAMLVRPAVPHAATDISGTWDLEMKFPAATSTGTCVFTQNGDALTGTCGGADRFALRGQITGNVASWEFYVKQGGSEGRMRFTGELDAPGTTITGSCSVVDGADGTFTLKKHS